jgi:hypothetical protein
MIMSRAIRQVWTLGAFFVAAVLPATSFAVEDTTRPTEKATAEELAQAKQMVQGVLNQWDFKTWNQVLAEDVTLNFKLGTVGINSTGLPAAAGADLEARGRDDAKKVLKQVYGDLKKNVKITGEVAYGYDVILLGELNVTTAPDNPQALPIACHMHFNSRGKIDKVVVASVDTRQLLNAIRK